MSRLRLLYLSPIVPAVTGNGLAMRAGMAPRALAARYEVTLLVVPVYGGLAAEIPVEVVAACREIVLLPRSPTLVDAPPGGPGGRLGCGAESTGSTPGEWRGLERPLRDVPFDVVHVFRLAMLPFARAYFAPPGRNAPRTHLDLDDVESTTSRRLAALYRLNGDPALADQSEVEARRQESLEAEVLRTLDRIYVCSENDRQMLLARRPRGQICVLPNALPVPPPLPPKRPDAPFRLLFIGTLGYYPNQDGVTFFCAEVLPILRSIAPRPFELVIAGIGMTPAICALGSSPEVRPVGWVAEVAPWYAEADAVVVPIRAGGGTRIKVLEAFAYRRPVVSTTVGAEGIAARDGQHLLLGDTPRALAEQCARLMREPALGRRLAEQAYAFFEQAHTLEAAAAAVAACDGARPRWRWWPRRGRQG